MSGNKNAVSMTTYSAFIFFKIIFSYGSLLRGQDTDVLEDRQP
jgi:hypothetical protein